MRARYSTSMDRLGGVLLMWTREREVLGAKHLRQFLCCALLCVRAWLSADGVGAAGPLRKAMIDHMIRPTEGD
jgi:hypothetical protein